MLPKLSEIQFKRRMLGLTQSDLAREVGISQSAIAKIEQKHMIPNYNMGKKIFEKLDCLEKKTEKTATAVMRKKIFQISPEDTLETAVNFVIKRGFSTIPVLLKGKVVGKITETSIVRAGKENYDNPCEAFMEPPPTTVSKTTPISTLREILKEEPFILVTGEGGKIVGLITRSDVL